MLTFVRGARSLDELVAAFRGAALPRAEWTHAAHLGVGAWHVHHFGAEAALGLLRAGITQLNERHGTASSSSSGYHETITAAYVRLIEVFLSTFEVGAPLERRVEALLASPLGQRSALLEFWSRERLMSPAARAAWCRPI